MSRFPTELIIKSPNLLGTSLSWKGLHMNISCCPLNGHLRSAWLPLLLYTHSGDYISKIWGNFAVAKWMCLHLAHTIVLKWVFQLLPMYKSESDITEHNDSVPLEVSARILTYSAWILDFITSVKCYLKRKKKDRYNETQWVYFKRMSKFIE